MKKLILTFGFLFLFSLPALAQQATCPVMPKGFICLTQEAANKAAEDKRVRTAQEVEIVELKASVQTEKDNVVKAKQTGIDNQAKLEAQLHDTDVKLGEKTGALTQCQAGSVRDSAMIEFLVKNQRSKQQGLINVKLGGN